MAHCPDKLSPLLYSIAYSHWIWNFPYRLMVCIVGPQLVLLLWSLCSPGKVEPDRWKLVTRGWAWLAFTGLVITNLGLGYSFCILYGAMQASSLLQCSRCCEYHCSFLSLVNESHLKPWAWINSSNFNRFLLAFWSWWERQLVQKIGIMEEDSNCNQA